MRGRRETNQLPKFGPSQRASHAKYGLLSMSLPCTGSVSDSSGKGDQKVALNKGSRTGSAMSRGSCTSRREPKPREIFGSDFRRDDVRTTSGKGDVTVKVSVPLECRSLAVVSQVLSLSEILHSQRFNLEPALPLQGSRHTHTC